MIVFDFKETSTTRLYNYGNTLSLRGALAILEPPDGIFGNLPPLGHQQDAHAVERVHPAPGDQDALGFCCRRKRRVLRPRKVINLDPCMRLPHVTEASVYVVCVQIRIRHVHPAFRSEEHTSELQSLMRISYAVFCFNKKTKK